MKALIFLLTLAFPAAGHAQWFLIPPSATTASSTAVMSITPFNSAYETVALTIEYAPNLSCQPAMGVMFVKRGGKGRPLTTSLEPGGALMFEIGRQKWLAVTNLIRYENGLEAIAKVSPALVNRIKTGESIRVTYGNNLAVEFPAVRQAESILAAERLCLGT